MFDGAFVCVSDPRDGAGDGPGEGASEAGGAAQTTLPAGRGG